MAQSFKNLRTLTGMPGRSSGVLAFILLALAFLATSHLCDIRHFPYDAGTYWLLATDPQRLPHEEIIRGYFLALLLGLPVRALGAIGVDPKAGFAKEGAWWIVLSATFLLFYFGITESTIANVRGSWPVP